MRKKIWKCFIQITSFISHYFNI